MKQQIDLNSDIGDGFGTLLTADGVDDEIMPLISSANIANGLHVGDANTMQPIVGLAAKHNVSVDAKPSFRGIAAFLRRHINANNHELVNDFVHQGRSGCVEDLPCGEKRARRHPSGKLGHRAWFPPAVEVHG